MEAEEGYDAKVQTRNTRNPGRSSLLFSSLLFSQLKAEALPPSCSGGESFQITIQGSVNGGNSWSTGSAYVQGQPGQQITVAVRVLLTVTSGLTQGWSFGIEHDPANLSLLEITTAGTNTATVRAGGPPSTNNTAIRSGFNGFTQGVIIDTAQEYPLNPVANFVLARACYRIQLPYYFQGYLYPGIRVTNQIGNPKVRAVVVQNGRSTVPCVRNFTFNVYVSTFTYPTIGGCDIHGYWSSAGTGLPVELQDSKGMDAEMAALVAGAGGLAEPPLLPFSCADANSDRAVDIADPIFVLNYLFLGGDQPFRIDRPERVITTAQTQPFGPVGFSGSDGHYQAGLPRQYVDNNPVGTVTDRTTGLMWTKSAVDFNGDTVINQMDRITQTSAQPDINARLNNNNFADHNDWRLPTVRELLSIADLGRGNGEDPAPTIPAADPVFVFPGYTQTFTWQFWTSATSPPEGMNIPAWYVNFRYGHVNEAPISTQDTLLVRAVRKVLASDDDPNLDPNPPHEQPLNGPWPPPVPFFVGDADGSAALDLTDAVYILSYLFQGGPKPCLVDWPILPSRRNQQGEFVEVQAGVVQDQRAGLQWRKAPSGNLVNWNQAIINSEDDGFADKFDWRLPNAYELHSLQDFNPGGTAVVHPIFQLPPKPFPWPAFYWPIFWTSTTDISAPNRAFFVIFHPDASVLHNFYLNENAKSSFLPIWSVRGGLPPPP